MTFNLKNVSSFFFYDMFRCLLHSVLDLLKASGGGSTRISRLCTHLRTMEGAAAMLGGGTTATRNRGGDDGGAASMKLFMKIL